MTSSIKDVHNEGLVGQMGDSKKIGQRWTSTHRTSSTYILGYHIHRVRIPTPKKKQKQKKTKTKQK